MTKSGCIRAYKAIGARVNKRPIELDGRRVPERIGNEPVLHSCENSVKVIELEEESL